MKVLFAVNDEKDAESITRMYQKEYKEIITSKTVYYYNAIIKELQKDKTYDRIVISEDLEMFSSDNYQAVDKFIFDKMDAISDEATNVDGSDIPIILLCMDRRTKNDPLLVKLFGLGIYNVLIGQDRSVKNVIDLMYRPRNKKEAKAYYKVEAEKINYTSNTSDNGVSESEIQNILNHYKRIGGNTQKCVQSFDSIVSQYSKEQVKLIIKTLPNSVKLILENNSNSYRKIMGITGKKKDENSVLDQKEYVEKEIDVGNRLTQPVIIPTAVASKKISKATGELKNKEMLEKKKAQERKAKAEAEARRKEEERKAKAEAEAKRKEEERKAKAEAEARRKEEERKAKAEAEARRKEEERKAKAEAEAKRIEEERKAKEMEEKNKKKKQAEKIEKQTEETTVKRGRGRPRKNPIIEEVLEDVPVKRKRGRPRKNPIIEEEVVTEKVDEKNKKDSDNIVVKKKNKKQEVEEPVVEDVKDDILLDFDDFEDDVKETPVESNKSENTDDFDFEEYDEDSNDDSYDFDYDDDDDDEIPEFDDYDEDDEEKNESEDEDNYEDESEDEEDDDFDDYDFDDIDDDYEEEINSEVDNEDENEEDDDEDDYDFDFDDLDELDEEIDESDEDEYEDTDSEDEYDDEDDETLPGFDDYEDEEENEDTDSEEIDDEDEEDEDDDYDFDFDDLDEAEDNQKNEEEFEDEEEDDVLPGFDDYEEEDEDETLPGFDDYEDEDIEPEENIEEEKQHNGSFKGINNKNYRYDNDLASSIKDLKETEETTSYNVDTDNLITSGQKIVSFVGTTKNGTSFIVNNLAELFSNRGIKTAILDLTKNKNAYYIYTDNDDNLRAKAHNCLENLKNGVDDGIVVNKNLTVFTSLPNEDDSLDDVTNIIHTLLENYTIVLLDCDFETDVRYFKAAQEIYLVQSLDVLTIQPLTGFLRDMKVKNVLEPSKLRIIINKNIKVGSLNEKVLIGGMSVYNDPAMTYMTELFNRDTIKYATIPFEDQVYAKYLEGLVNCKISSKGYSKNFIASLSRLGDMVYPTINGKKVKNNYNNYSNQNAFSKDTNSILDKMKKKY